MQYAHATPTRTFGDVGKLGNLEFKAGKREVGGDESKVVVSCFMRTVLPPPLASPTILPD